MTAALLAAFLIAQSPSTQLIDSAQVERVQKALAQEPALETTQSKESDRPVFRLKVQAPLQGPPAWVEQTSVPAYAKPSYPLYHWEFLQQVTPEEFKASALYPGATGPTLTPLFDALFKGSNAAIRRHQEAAARKEVREA